jgi:hypothetical protein
LLHKLTSGKPVSALPSYVISHGSNADPAARKKICQKHLLAIAAAAVAAALRYAQASSKPHYNSRPAAKQAKSNRLPRLPESTAYSSLYVQPI